MMYPILCKVRFESLQLLLRSPNLWVQIGKFGRRVDRRTALRILEDGHCY
jgi:hypothetical protein